MSQEFILYLFFFILAGIHCMIQFPVPGPHCTFLNIFLHSFLFQSKALTVNFFSPFIPLTLPIQAPAYYVLALQQLYLKPRSRAATTERISVVAALGETVDTNQARASSFLIQRIVDPSCSDNLSVQCRSRLKSGIILDPDYSLIVINCSWAYAYFLSLCSLFFSFLRVSIITVIYYLWLHSTFPWILSVLPFELFSFPNLQQIKKLKLK